MTVQVINPLPFVACCGVIDVDKQQDLQYIMDLIADQISFQKRLECSGMDNSIHSSSVATSERGSCNSMKVYEPMNVVNLSRKNIADLRMFWPGHDLKLNWRTLQIDEDVRRHQHKFPIFRTHTLPSTIGRKDVDVQVAMPKEFTRDIFKHHLETIARYKVHDGLKKIYTGPKSSSRLVLKVIVFKVSDGNTGGTFNSDKQRMFGQAFLGVAWMLSGNGTRGMCRRQNARRRRRKPRYAEETKEETKEDSCTMAENKNKTRPSPKRTSAQTAPTGEIQPSIARAESPKRKSSVPKQPIVYQGGIVTFEKDLTCGDYFNPFTNNGELCVTQTLAPMCVEHIVSSIHLD